MKKMVSMELTPDEGKKEVSCDPCDVDKPKYPYGTCLYLCEDELKKLGIKDMPAVGVEIQIQAVAKVIGTSERETQQGSRKTLDLQITQLGLDAPEAPTTAMGKAAQKLYG